MTSSTMSYAPGYWPSEPTLMPWLPLQCMFCTKISVEFGLKETQSSPLFTTLSWMTMLLLRYVSQPSVFLATFALWLYPLMSMLSNTTSVVFWRKL